MKFFFFLFLFSQVLPAKTVKLKDLSVKRPNIGLTVAPKNSPRFIDKMSVSEKGFSIKPQTEFFEKLYAQDFNLEQTLKDLDVSRPPIEGKFQYQF